MFMLKFLGLTTLLSFIVLPVQAHPANLVLENYQLHKYGSVEGVCVNVAPSLSAG